MKDWIKITLGTLLTLIFCVIVAFSIVRLTDHYWATKKIFAKEIQDSTGCYIRIDKHFKIYYIEDGDYSQFKLFIDGVPTNIHTYSDLCDSKRDVVERILYCYYSRNDPPDIRHEYKLCKK